MTCIKFLTDENGLYGFEISGHSSKSCDDTSGKIVCSAVSSAAYMAANTISEVIGDRHKADISDAFMSFEVLNPTESSRTVLKGLKLHLTELCKQYSDRIRIITEV